MMSGTLRVLKQIKLWLLLGFVIVFVIHLSSAGNLLNQLKPQSIVSYTLNISFEQNDESVNIETYIPQDTERQQILQESVIASGLGYLVREEKSGRVGQWNGRANVNNNETVNIEYKALLVSQEIEYAISPSLSIAHEYPIALSPYLQATDAIQVNHPEITALWHLIKPNDESNTLSVIKAIYQYTHQEISGAPFKGFTDALTALRLKQASCNGKSRLFVALARYNNLPARLVGGIILNPGSKKTSHQWVEVYIEGHWIPFGPTNGNFAKLPANYLTLYKTDQVLFKHTSDINFDYIFNIDRRLVAPSLYSVDKDVSDSFDRTALQEINITQLLLRMGLAPQTVGLFLLFPLCTLLITFLRNIIGLKTFGIFMPMLIAAACVFTGFFKGIISFIVILFFSFVAHSLLDKLRLLKIPRLAAIITLNTLFFIVGLSFIGTSSQMEFGMLSLFPVVIISFIAEKIHNLTNESDWLELFYVSLGTLVSIWLCFIILSSFLLEGLFSFYPEIYMLVLAAQIHIGQWTGLRLSELSRFKDILNDKENPVLGINARNRDVVYQLNEKRKLRLAADKLQSKVVLIEAEVAVPATLLSIDSIANLALIEPLIEGVKQFALKPNQGSQGNGILILVDKNEQGFITAGGRLLSVDQIKKHCIEIIAGNYSQSGENDIAYFEPLLIQHQLLEKIAPYGLSDIRVIVSRGKVISAMLRVPTKSSDGKANLHQGAVGIAVDIKTGITTNAQFKKKNISHHPDNQAELINVQLPFWPQIIEMSLTCQLAIGLGYIGVDICIDEKQGPLVLEVNGRPGIEIQNVQNKGFYNEFQ